MNVRDEANWVDLNQAWLTREVRALSARIAARLGADGAPGAADLPPLPPFEPALERCVEALGLSPFEREVLLLLAGIELDAVLRRQVREALGHDGAPDFGFALAALDHGHWDAISPLSPLRRWQLVELEGRAGPARQGLRIAERVLHFLTGVDARDERLFGLLRPRPDTAAEADAALRQTVLRALAGDGTRVPVALLVPAARADRDALRRAAADTLAALSCEGLWLAARDLPGQAAELADIALLLDREALFARALPVIELEAAAEPDAARALTLLAHLQTPALLLGSADPAPFAQLPRHRVTRVDVAAGDERTLLALAHRHARHAAHADLLADALGPALRQFPLAPAQADAVLAIAAEAGDDGLPARVWQACRERARGGLDALAQRVESAAGFDDLVLPAAALRQLRDIAGHLQHRHRVYGQWNMHGCSRRGQGLCALFAGEPGTGKTLAAEAIANEAGLDLYRIDLATVVSKYIGETEKNLGRLFDAAESSGAVLLFDEADALFGKRSEVKDSHDRYANIEVAYLLQRVEVYRGLAILTTNLKTALDRAFLRRIRFVVQFPFPDAAARAALWRQVFAPHVPTEGLEPERLAKLTLSGGSIRNVAVNAAFLAAAGSGCIDTAAIQAAALAEFAKLDRPAGDLRLEA